MKTWKFSFFLFWIAIGFTACQDSSKHIYPRYEQFPETYNESCVQEIGNDSVFFRYPYRIDIKDSLAILLDLHNDSHFLYAFTFPDWQPITPFGKRGEGPDEILSAKDTDLFAGFHLGTRLQPGTNYPLESICCR